MSNKNKKVITNNTGKTNKGSDKKTANKNKAIVISIIAVVIAAIAVIAIVIALSKDDNKSGDSTEYGKTKIPETICQYSEPTKGELVAELYIKNYGVIKVKFFETEAPKAVENFVKHAKEGYYDGVTFHRVIDDFMIQGGDPTGTGRGGESIWGVDFADEISKHLMPVRGALCMANTGQESSNSSQFFIVQSKKAQDTYVEQLKKLGVDTDLVDYYEKNGGAGWLYGAHTVFGQVYVGMDIVDSIAMASTDASDKPLEDVIIEKILIKEY